MSRERVSGVARRNGLDCSGIEFLWMLISATLEQTDPVAHQTDPVAHQTDPVAHPAPRTMITGSLSRGKAAGAWREAPTQSSAEVKESVDLYLTPGATRSVLRWTSSVAFITSH